jgi:GGDEF domain-containing protein
MLDLEKNCKEELPLPLEAAYGIAYRSEIGGDADTVYHAADKRMYEMKSKMKSKLVRK